MTRKAGRPKAEKINVVSVKVSASLHDGFKQWADKNGLTVSSALRSYMARMVQQEEERQLQLAERQKILRGE